MTTSAAYRIVDGISVKGVHPIGGIRMNRKCAEP